MRLFGSFCRQSRATRIQSDIREVFINTPKERNHRYGDGPLNRWEKDSEGFVRLDWQQQRRTDKEHWTAAFMATIANIWILYDGQTPYPPRSGKNVTENISLIWSIIITCKSNLLIAGMLSQRSIKSTKQGHHHYGDFPRWIREIKENMKRQDWYGKPLPADDICHWYIDPVFERIPHLRSGYCSQNVWWVSCEMRWDVLSSTFEKRSGNNSAARFYSQSQPGREALIHDIKFQTKIWIKRNQEKTTMKSIWFFICAELTFTLSQRWYHTHSISMELSITF